MAVTYKDISLLTQKASVAGTEKIPVSDTEFITPSQIVSGVRADLDILLEHVDWSGLTVVYRFIDPSNKWASGNNPRCVFVPLVPGKKYSVKYETSGTIAILQDYSSTIGDTPNWATGFVGRIVITDEYNFVAPPDAQYMYLLTGYNGVDYTPEYITALENGSVTDVTLGGTSVLSPQGVAVLPTYPTVPTISTSVEADKTDNTKTSSPKSVYDHIEPTRRGLNILLEYEDLSNLTVWKRQINSSGNWTSYTSSDPDESVILPITPGERYCVVAKDANTFVAPLTSTTPATSGAAPFATGYSSRISVEVGTPFVFDAPSDAAGLYILLVTHSGTECATEVYHLTGLAEYLKYKMLNDESEVPANPVPGTLYLIPETS